MNDYHQAELTEKVSGPLPTTGDDNILDWDAYSPPPPPKRSGTIRVRLRKRRAEPLPSPEPDEG